MFQDDDAGSETSEEFVLEGDTDGEDDVREDIMAAPTLAMETQVRIHFGPKISYGNRLASFSGIESIPWL